MLNQMGQCLAGIVGGLSVMPWSVGFWVLVGLLFLVGLGALLAFSFVYAMDDSC